MSIQNLKIKNFRSLGELNLNINEEKRVICFVGENGSSKTSILSLIVDSFISNCPINFIDFKTKDLKRYRLIDLSEIGENNDFYTLHFNYKSLDTEYIYNRVVSKNIDSSEYQNYSNGLIIKNGSIYKEEFKPKQSEQINFFKQNVFLFRPSYRYEYDGSEVATNYSEEDFSTSIKFPHMGEFPYKFQVAHSGKDIQKNLIELLLDSYIGYADSKVAFSKLPKILNKITNKDYGNLQISRTPYRRLVSSKIGSVSNFSQGELDLIVTITSIMERQLFIFNNNEFPKNIENFMDVPGLVIIDEVDLHLHPKAQESYLKILTETFKNIQFIITTHSPFVIRGLPSDSVVIQLPTGNLINNDFSAMDIDTISDHIFNISGRFTKDIENDLERFRALIVDREIDKIKEIYNKYKNSSSLKNELDTYLFLLPNDLIKEVVG